MKQLMMILALLLTSLLAACAGGDAPTAVPDPTPIIPDDPGGYPLPDNENAPNPPYPAGDDTAVSEPAYPAPVDPDPRPPVEPGENGDANTLERLTNLVVQDLAKRQSLDAAQITIQSREAVQWSDSALGCPAPGFAYLQVITPGYKIVLEAEGNVYNYHTGRGDSFVLCGKDGTPVE